MDEKRKDVCSPRFWSHLRFSLGHLGTEEKARQIMTGQGDIIMTFLNARGSCAARTDHLPDCGERGDATVPRAAWFCPEIDWAKEEEESRTRKGGKRNNHESFEQCGFAESCKRRRGARRESV